MRPLIDRLASSLLLLSLLAAVAQAKGAPKPAHHSAPQHHNPPPQHHNPPPQHHNPPKPPPAPKMHASAKPKPAPKPAPAQASQKPEKPKAKSVAAAPKSPPRRTYSANRHSSSRGSGRYYASRRTIRPRRTPVRRNPESLAQARLLRLKQDLDGLKPQLTVTQSQKNRLSQDLMAVAEGPTKIGQKPVKQLASDLADGLGRRKSGRLDSQATALYLKELMNSSGTARAAVKTAVSRGKALLTSGGVATSDAEQIANGFRDVLAAFTPGLAGIGLR